MKGKRAAVKESATAKALQDALAKARSQDDNDEAGDRGESDGEYESGIGSRLKSVVGGIKRGAVKLSSWTPKHVRLQAQRVARKVQKASAAEGPDTPEGDSQYAIE
ncbi:hypothetical protein PBRA_000344 [Plasmodiophora brassicae]|uniref:Uncharacterized protein n=1 Tax=Plasmodiophora brassicae TaxID=37360 RepID=A0A0G4IHD4_PLABS|nr:hypothetical protein PBRA_000344 [Plasmodiophora brassicae]